MPKSSPKPPRRRPGKQAVKLTPPAEIRQVPKAVSAILEDLVALTDDDLGLFFWSISEGMWDEWDCSLAQGIEIFGEVEMRVAIKSAVYAAKAIENDQNANERDRNNSQGEQSK